MDNTHIGMRGAGRLLVENSEAAVAAKVAALSGVGLGVGEGPPGRDGTGGAGRDGPPGGPGGAPRLIAGGGGA